MASKHLTEDEIRYTVDVKTADAQKAIYTLEQQSKKLRSENKARLSQMISLEAAGRKESETYRNLKKQYSETSKEIRTLTDRIGEQTSKIDILDMSMVQLKKQQKSLQKELDNTVQSLNPEAYGVLEQRLKDVSGRISELKQNAKSFGELASDDTVNGVLLGNLLTKGAELFSDKVREFTDSIAELINGGLEMAEQADGVTKAFNDLNQEGLLDNLRKATKGTVNDVQLMTAAVQANDFRIPLEDLGKYLEFAQLKAQQTGQSVDYMTNSIVTGLGRKSPLILDNLGISAAEISEKTKETGDFMKAVAEIVDTQLAEAGETYISAADRAAQKTVELQNAQKALGDEILPLKEQWDDAYADMQLNTISLISWCVKHQGVVKTLGILLTAFTVVAIATSNAIKTNIVVTKGAAAAQQAWNVISATGIGLMKLLQAGFLLLTGRVTQAKAAWASMNATMKASVFGLIAAGVVLLAMKLWDMKKATDASTLAQKALNNIRAEAQKQVVEEKLKLENLIKVAKDEKLSMDERYRAVDALNKIVPQYNATIDKTTKKFKASDKALKAYINNLVKLYEVQGAKKQIQSLAEKRAELEVKLAGAKKNLSGAKSAQGVSYTTSWGAVGNTQSDAVGHFQSQVNSISNSIKQLDVQIHTITGAFGKGIMSQTVKESSEPEVPGSGIGGGGGKGGGGHTGTVNTTTTTQPNPDDIASKRFSENRQADIDAANQDYQQDVNNWEMALAQKQVSQEKYDLAMQALKTQHTANILAIETSYSEQSQNIGIADGAKKKALQDKQQANLRAAEQAHFEQQVAVEQAYQDALAKVMEQGETQQELTLEQQRDQKLEVLRGYYQAALNMAKQNGEDTTQLEKAYKDVQAQIKKEYTTKQNELLDEQDEKKKQARQALGFDQQSEYDRQLLQLKQALDNRYITQQEYEEKVQQLKRDSFMKQAQYYTNLFSNAVTSLQNAEMANVDAKYDAEIKAAEGNTALQEKLEKKKANEKLKIQKKYADVNFAMQVAQIVSNTAVSIMKAYSELGPIAGSVAAALMGVTGAAQLAVANAERQKVKRMTLNGTASGTSSAGSRVASGRESGGRIDVEREQDGKHFNAEYAPGKRGYVDHPTVIVGEGPRGRSKEWVASNAALVNPTIAPLINLMDAAQRAGQIRTFDMSKYLMAMQGRALGGSIARQSARISPETASGGADFYVRTQESAHRDAGNATSGRNNDELLELLRELKRDGIRSFVSLSDLDAKQELRNQARKFAKK
ncbi:2-oxoacid:ferredoxin oxidoreductase subunit delta [Segatella copri]|uniref:2-oxoacid:ferredoxin oxidoreductase subunit delta n=1 Tax=Segatella copri TaxID=165179 RepID=A0AAW4MXY5_9BACT|nr:2-oxoacid:ferredoxin oxidoreductase subunit delta [Segatella copri]MBV3386236.1 2-oxoacid:ferredoxin oxidoreductase subunit delta [Segatella copri]MBV3394268.1 2-oxoacid:ferredoxin oxidoreductase subunit delta [Segatella copri]MBV3404022.1 2-oxoacid:ferredoxin oxidoreductase subunit delta [Segatella copri]